MQQAFRRQTRSFVTQSIEKRQRRRTIVASTAMTAAVAWITLDSLQTRRERRQLLQELEPVTWEQHFPNRTWQDLLETIQRCGLMGGTRSVKQDLDHIREWHHAHGYKGGVVLRDLTQPVGWGEEEEWSLQEIVEDPTRLNRRECYYMYYELSATGRVKQEIFCRGTTIWADLLTCLEAWMVYDEELDCRVHRGFRNQADRILRDLEPLLANRDDRRATINVCGHSLGAAVAFILAAKLRQRGYRVSQLTAIGLPRFCASPSDAAHIETLLPVDTVRVAHEFDFVSFLPPFGSFSGKKLWIVDDEPRLLSFDTDWWSDKVWFNFLAWEILSANGVPHRIPTYLNALRAKKP